MSNLQFLNKEFKGLSIIVMGDKEDNTYELEARAEADVRFQRVKVYAATKLDVALSLIKKNSIDLAIFTDPFEGKDFVFVQNEIKNANAGTSTLPLLKDLNLTKIRESRQIGNLFDFGSLETGYDYQYISSLILNFCREKSNQTNEANIYEPIRNALLVGRDDFGEIKSLSAVLSTFLAQFYDVSNKELDAIQKAQLVYFPWIAASKYTDLLSATNNHDVVSVLEATGSKDLGREPSNSHGMIVTASFYLAESAINASVQDALDLVKIRPPFLRHKSLRTISTTEILSQISVLLTRAQGRLKKDA